MGLFTDLFSKRKKRELDQLLVRPLLQGWAGRIRIEAIGNQYYYIENGNRTECASVNEALALIGKERLKKMVDDDALVICSEIYTAIERMMDDIL